MSNYKLKNSDGIVFDTNGKGIGLPQIDNINNATTSGIQAGSLMYAIAQNSIYYFNGTAWISGQGTSGTSGVNGSSGSSGTAGSSGSTGTSGSSGSTGSSGSSGSTGTSGSSGSTGSSGSSGSTGTSGSAGSSGSTGTSGSSGTSGTAGTGGSSGSSGSSGVSMSFKGTYSAGTTYAANDVVYHNGSSYVSLLGGNVGNTPNSSPSQWSLAALAGTNGTSGSSGSTGSSGSSGQNGSSGSSGQSGAAGSSGSSGSSGQSGAAGSSGSSGQSGAAGSSGSSGSSGQSGAAGSSGSSGQSGAAGSSGSSGSSGQSAATAITNNVDNYVVTATGSGTTPFNGEANLQFDGTRLTVNYGGTSSGQHVFFDTTSGNGGAMTFGLGTSVGPHLVGNTNTDGTARGAYGGSRMFFNSGGFTFDYSSTTSGARTWTTYADINSDGVLSIRRGSSSNDNIRFYNTDGNYSYIRTTAASNTNNTWFDAPLGATIWLGWDNPGQARTASTFSQVYVGTGRGTINETVLLRRGDIEGKDGAGTVNYRIVSTGALGSHTFFNYGNVGIGTASPQSELDVSVNTRSGTHASSQALYVTADMGTGQTGGATGNIEFRHSNASQGIGFGYNTIYQTGTNTNQELNILSRGNSPITLNAFPYSTGNVGIGTASPSDKLHVRSSDTTGEIRIGGGNGAGNARIYIQAHASTAYIDMYGNNQYLPLQINASPVSFLGGNVGVGTSSFTDVSFGSSILKIAGTRATLGLTSSGSLATIAMIPASNTGLALHINQDNAGASRWYQYSAGGETFTLNASGNVGINQTSPNARLDVGGGITLRAERVTNSQKYPVGHYNTGETVFEIDPTWTQAQLQDFFGSTSVTWEADSTAPGYCIRITGGVNVGSGPYNSGFPYIPVDSSGGDWYYMECWIRNEAGSSIGHYMGGIDYNQSFTSLGGNPGSFTYNVMLNYNPGTSWTKVTGYWNGFGSSSGGSGTGNTNNWVSGTKYFTPQALFNYSQYSGTARCYISGWKCIRVSNPGNRYFTNNIYVSGDVVAYFSSDRRLKDNILRIESPLEKISKINGVTFNWNDNQKVYPVGKSDLGVIAQEIEEILPEIVEKRDTGYLAVKYEKLTPLLIEAIKELSTENTELKARLERIESKLKD